MVLLSFVCFIVFKVILKNVVNIVISVTLLSDNFILFQLSINIILFFSAARNDTTEPSIKKIGVLIFDRFLESISTIFVHFKSLTNGKTHAKKNVYTVKAIIRKVQQL